MPYQISGLNQVDLYSQMILIITLFLKLFEFSMNKNDLQIFSTIGILALNSIFFFGVIVYVGRIKFQQIKNVWKSMILSIFHINIRFLI